MFLRAVAFFSCLFTVSMQAGIVSAQPISDSVRAIQKLNERSYKMLEQLDPSGDSYTFTNVIKWKITDNDLQTQIREALAKEPFNLKREEFDVAETYLFAAPAGQDKVEPFHILVRGFVKEKVSKKKKKSVIGGLGDDDETTNTQMIPKAFQGRNVVRLMHRNPSLLENVNAVQGENVELPGDIVPHGSQLVKDTKMRYIFSRMFDQFYSKKVVIDEQRGYYGLPTYYKGFDLPADLAGSDSTIKSPFDPESTTALPDDQVTQDGLKETYYASRFDKLIDVSISDLRVNASRHLGFELELGNKEIGLPFWSSGQGRFWVNLKNQIGTESNFKLGFVFPTPFTMGTSEFLTFPARKLSGTFGGSVDAYFAGISFFSGFNLPLAFKFSFMPTGQAYNNSIIYNGEKTGFQAIDGTYVLIDPGQTFYRQQFNLQLYIPTIVQLDLNNFVQVSAGFGLSNIYQSMIPKRTGANGKVLYDYTLSGPGKHPLFAVDQADKIQDLVKVSNTIVPHLAFDYVNQQGSKFGLGIGYDHLFTASAWIELIEDRFRIEMSYSGPIIRDAKPYEPASFFLITPRLYF